MSYKSELLKTNRIKALIKGLGLDLKKDKIEESIHYLTFEVNGVDYTVLTEQEADDFSRKHFWESGYWENGNQTEPKESWVEFMLELEGWSGTIESCDSSQAISVTVNSVDYWIFER